MSTKNTKNIPLSRKPKNIKYYNQSLVLSLLRNHDIVSASEISKRINLSVTSVTKILTILQQLNLVKSMGKGSSTEEGGKKPELFALNDTYKYAISLISGGDKIKCVLFNLKCNILDSFSSSYREPDNFISCVEDIAASIHSLIANHHLQPADICGITVGFDGIVDSENGVLLFPIHNTAWGRSLPARQLLTELLPDFDSIMINNSARMAGYAELLQHPEYMTESILVITSGTSTGGCIIDRGTLMQGANGFVGEVGHVTVAPSYRAEQCACGNYGCFENMISPNVILGYARELKGNHPHSSLARKLGDLTYEDVFQASNESDPYACEIMDHIISYFVLLIRDIILIYDPKVIVLQGIYAQAGPYFLNTLRKEIHSLPFFEIKKELKIVYSDLIDFNGIFIGGALYTIDRYFKNADFFKDQENV